MAAMLWGWCGHVHAQTSAPAQAVWTGAVSSDFTNGANWQGGVAPTTIFEFTNNGAPTTVVIPPLATLNGNYPIYIRDFLINQNSPMLNLNIEGTKYTINTNYNSQNQNNPFIITAPYCPGICSVLTIFNPLGKVYFQNGYAGPGVDNQSGTPLTINVGTPNATQTFDSAWVGFTDQNAMGNSIINNYGTVAVSTDPIYITPPPPEAQISPTINNYGVLNFNGFATASAATITNYAGGLIQFNINATRGSATIVNAQGASIEFEGIDNGTSVIQNFGTIYYDQGASNNTNISNKGAILFNTFFQSGHQYMNIGSINGNGAIYLNNVQLSIGDDNSDSKIDGTITSAEYCSTLQCFPVSGPGSLTKIGTGTLTLNGINTYTGLTDVQAGKLVIGDNANPGAVVAGSVTIEPGATLGGYGTIQGTLTNNGIVIPGADVGTLTVNGNYGQSGTGSLLVAVTPTAASLLQVAGSASLSGNVTFAYAPGTYTRNTLTFLNAAGGIQGQFSSVSERGAVPTNVSRSVGYTATAANLLIAGGNPVPTPTPTPAPTPTLASASTSNSANSQQADATASQVAVDPPAPPDPPPIVIRPADERLFNARIGLAAGQAGQSLQALLERPKQGGVFVQSDTSPLHVATGPDATGYRATRERVLAGVDWPGDDEDRHLGVVFGFDDGWLHDALGGTAHSQTASLSVYGVTQAGPIRLSAAAGAGFNEGHTTRQTGAGAASQSQSGAVLAGGVLAEWPITLPWGDDFLQLSPGLGVRAVSVEAGGFREITAKQAAGFALAGQATELGLVAGVAHLGVAHSIALGQRLALRLSGDVGYEQASTTPSPHTRVIAADGTAFTTQREALGRGVTTLGLGAEMQRGLWAISMGYQAQLARNWTGQSFQAGLRMAF